MPKLSTACFLLSIFSISYALPSQIIIIRHGEKSINGDNLNCAGLNRSIQLARVLYNKFKIVNHIYVPHLNPKADGTKRSRMFQTITPYAVQYNIEINSSYNKDDFNDIVTAIKQDSGTVLFVWDHSNIPALASTLGVTDVTKWNKNDFDSIWIIDPVNKTLKITQEKISPSQACPN